MIYKPRSPLVLLINPWITDFAAHDLWAKPLGLLFLASLLREGGCGVALIDCLDREDPFTNSHPGVLAGRNKNFGTGKYPRMRIPKPGVYADFPRHFHRHGIHPESLRRKLSQIEKPDIVWITSIMTYWYPGVLETVRMVRETFPSVPVWLGGIYARLCTGHAVRWSGADRIITEDLSRIPEMLCDLCGFCLSNESVWGDFSSWPLPALDLLEPAPGYAPLLTGVGCPYRCPYCASSVLQPKRERFASRRIMDQIRWGRRVLGVSDFAFYDDALLLDAQHTLRPVLESIAKKGPGIRFHVPNALHVRALSKNWCELLYASGFRTIRLGLETALDGRSLEWGGKVHSEMYLEAIGNLFAAGFCPEDVGTYLLCGLPGQSPEEVAQSIDFVRQSGVRPYICEFSPIPGTPMWDKALALSAFDLAAEPLYHNNTFFACRRPDFTLKDMVSLKTLAGNRNEKQKG
ncbi:MAG: B12-binding domain-containing radical SAM protein [Syntrophobacteraceae bacterium]